jgi:hypothetical protein
MQIVRRALFSLLLAACATSEPEGEELSVTCEGKCDGIGNLKSFIRDAKELDLGDLVAVGSKLGADEISGALSGDFASIKLDEPRFFALPGVAEPDLTLENIDTLVSGLAARFGERELSTEVNAVRRAHLMAGSDKVFVESAFRLGGNSDWGNNVGGFDNASVRIGFGVGGSLEARVIGAYRSELQGVSRGPLKALTDLRGFVFPRGIDEIRKMKPGESFALSGEGHLGANLGAGVPILIANPGNIISYNIVISAGLRARIAGQLDVQLVRLDGDEIVIDVGMQRVREWSAKLAIDDAWGVQGLLRTNISLGGIEVDLGKLADKALQKQLNSKLNLFSAELSKSNTASRVSVARLRFGLDGGDASVIAPAIAQALKGDVRLAQALANRGEPGVIAEFDLLRSGSSTTSFAGIDILGMSFFKKTIASEGEVIIQTPGGARSLLFQSLRKSSGSFFSEHGYTRVGLSGLNFDPNNPGEARGEANLFVQLQEADDFMERDKMLDHVDALILALGGKAALASIETHGNALERFVEQTCPNSQAFDPCRVSVLSNPTVIDLRTKGVDAARAAATNLTSTQGAELIKLADFRMTTQATYEPKAALVGPESTFTIDYRFDDAALNFLMTERDATSFKSALHAYASAVKVNRLDEASNLAANRAKLERDLKAQVDELAAKYDAARTDYRKLLGVERAVLQKIGPVGPRLLEVRVPVDQNNRPLYEEAAVGSLAEARSRVVTKMFDSLVKKSSGFSTHVEQVSGYALLGMLEPSRIDLRVDARIDVSDGFSQNFEHYRAAGYGSFDIYGKGDKVAPIDGGLFSIDALIEGQ